MYMFASLGFQRLLRCVEGKNLLCETELRPIFQKGESLQSRTLEPKALEKKEFFNANNRIHEKIKYLF